ncbi:MAG: GDSL-like Lipase/Acylhydrolase [Verrucomicrobia bacterium ADurb.Bin118]|nr:MAG: GDSL-like Lipase/Acylhydrolase [Verrucomicrobia bacterium ADurb.Bin118]
MKHQTVETHALNRRGFLKTSGAALGAASVAGLASACRSLQDSSSSGMTQGAVILFQGDSITDAGRSRDPALTAQPNQSPALGSGYASLAAAALLVSQSAAGFKIYNRGISGNKVFQLAERWTTDCLALQPDVLSILVGVNDLWHTLDPRIGYNGTVEIYERDYQALVERTRRALPRVKLVICEPFVLRCGAVNNRWFPEFDRYRAAARRVADRHQAVFVPFQSMFDEAIKFAPPDHWAKDGVHPSSAGASLMAYFWLQAVRGKS